MNGMCSVERSDRDYGMVVKMLVRFIAPKSVS